jgi:hypothetical protein
MFLPPVRYLTTEKKETAKKCTMKIFIIRNAYLLSTIYYCGDQTRRMGWTGHVAQIMCTCSILVCKPEGNRPPGRPGRRRKGNIRNGS